MFSIFFTAVSNSVEFTYPRNDLLYQPDIVQKKGDLSKAGRVVSKNMIRFSIKELKPEDVKDQFESFVIFMVQHLNEINESIGIEERELSFDIVGDVGVNDSRPSLFFSQNTIKSLHIMKAILGIEVYCVCEDAVV